jgi:hypothetical protein
VLVERSFTTCLVLNKMLRREINNGCGRFRKTRMSFGILLARVFRSSAFSVDFMENWPTLGYFEKLAS